MRKHNILAIALVACLSIGNVSAVLAESIPSMAERVDEACEIKDDLTTPNTILDSGNDASENAFSHFETEDVVPVQEIEIADEENVAVEVESVESSEMLDKKTESFAEDPEELEELLFEQSAGATSGNCGFYGQESKVKWALSGSGDNMTLTISGSGQMMYYDGGDMPWVTYRSKITKVVVKDGVTSIGMCAFSSFNNLTSVSLANSITEICYGAFESCTKLKSITLPSNLKIINGFSGCSGLTSLTLPGKVVEIGSGAFMGCSGLTSLTIPSSVKTCSMSAFSGCSSLKSLMIPNSVTSFGYSSYADFSSCSSLQSIKIPSGITDVYCYGCKSLTSITIPDSVTHLDLSECEKLVNVSLPKSVTELSMQGCRSLKSIAIPSGMTKVPAWAFSDCSSLTSVSIPSTVTKIEEYAFYGCSSLQTLTLPDSVKIIENGAFCDCTSLKTLKIPNGVTSFDLYAVHNTALENFVIPKCVKSMEEMAFYGNEYLKSITIPGSIAKIENWAFSECNNLESVTIENGVKNIGNYAFYNCTKLKSLSIPDSVTSIGDEAFWGCTGIEKIRLPKNIQNISDVGLQGLKNLKEVILPEGITDLYLSDLYSLEKVNIPNTVQTINLSNCYSLTSLKLPEGITYVDLSYCTALASLEIPESVISIDLSHCSSLDSIIIPGNVYDMDLSYCNGLETAIIQAGVETIKEDLFENCYNLHYVEIPDTATSIGAYAFYNCSRLESIIIPDSVTYIDRYAFSRSGIRDVYYQGSEEEWNAIIGYPDYYQYDNIIVHYNTVPVSLITLDKENLDLYVGEKYDLIINTKPYYAPVSGLEIVSYDEGVINVDENGRITAVGPGSAYVSVTAIDTGVQAECLVNVKKKEPGLTFAEKNIFKKPTDGAFINPLTYKTDGELTFSSSNKGVADVTEFGAVIIKSVGTTIIRVESPETKSFNAGSAEYTLTVHTLEPSVSYQAKVVGESNWQAVVKDGAEAGTTGKSLIMEAFKINLTDKSTGKNTDSAMLGVEYSGHVQNVGWESWVSNGSVAGRPGKALRIEALKLRLTGELAGAYDIYYCLHCQNYGWLGWAKNGAESGTAGMALRVEAIRIQILPKGSPAPARLGNYSQTYMFSPEIFYSSYVQGRGWQKEVRKNNLSGTSGESLRLEGFKIRVSGEKNLGVRYKGHVQNVGWMDWVEDNHECGQPGKNRRIEALQLELTGADKDKYDIYYCLHVQNFGWLAWAKNGQKSGSSGVSMRVEAYVIRILPKGSPKPKNLGSRTETFIDGVGATKLTLNKTTVKVARNKTVSLSATVLPANRTFKGVTWKSSNTSIATVSGGVVTGKKKGTATITCTSNDGRVSAVCTVTVT